MILHLLNICLLWSLDNTKIRHFLFTIRILNEFNVSCFSQQTSLVGSFGMGKFVSKSMSFASQLTLHIPDILGFLFLSQNTSALNLYISFSKVIRMLYFPYFEEHLAQAGSDHKFIKYLLKIFRYVSYDTGKPSPALYILYIFSSIKSSGSFVFIHCINSQLNTQYIDFSYKDYQ